MGCSMILVYLLLFILTIIHIIYGSSFIAQDSSDCSAVQVTWEVTSMVISVIVFVLVSMHIWGFDAYLDYVICLSLLWSLFGLAAILFSSDACKKTDLYDEMVASCIGFLVYAFCLTMFNRCGPGNQRDEEERAEIEMA